MKISRRVVVFVVTCTIVSALLGLLSGFLVTHGEHAISLSLRVVIGLGVAGFLSGISGFRKGNRAQPRASAEEDRLAKQFMPVAERAVVYVFRDAFVGKLLGIDFALDGYPLGQTRGKTYFRLELAPGEHVLRSSNPQDNSFTEYRLSTAACSIVFVEHRVRLGPRALKHDFVVVEAACAGRRIERCRLLAAATVVGVAEAA